jgi:hypothetical protein
VFHGADGFIEMSQTQPVPWNFIFKRWLASDFFSFGQTLKENSYNEEQEYVPMVDRRCLNNVPRQCTKFMSL